jgi:hypothetical protein
VNSIQANGVIILEGTQVLGLVQVNGSLEANEASMNSLQVNGQVALKNCLINNVAYINGSLTAKPKPLKWVVAHRRHTKTLYTSANHSNSHHSDDVTAHANLAKGA